MSFGGGGDKDAKAAAALARKGRQSASEEAGRAQQQAERGSTRRKGRSLLLGNLSRDGSATVGGASAAKGSTFANIFSSFFGGK